MKKLIITIIVLLVSIIGYAQINVNQKNGNWVFGGGFNIGFNNGFNISASPEVGYRIDKLEFGLSAGYTYINFDGNNTFSAYESSLFTVGPYALYSLTNNIYLRGQYQYVSGTTKFKNNSSLDIKNDENALWLGGGYQSKLANNVYLRLGFLYNVLYDSEDSVYSSAFVPNAGISVGL